MKSTVPLLRKPFMVVALLLLLAAGGLGAWSWYLRAHPEVAFRWLTGRDLPPGVRAVAYANEITDNLFRTTHYWQLEGTAPALRQVTEGTGFAESTEEARWILPDLNEMFGLPWTRSDVLIGYESELDHDCWYVIFAGETSALYAL
jgi:hypothetical protein